MDDRQRRPRALFGNAAFEAVAGSELVIMELAEDLIRRGWDCDLTSWSFGSPMRSLATRGGLGLLLKPAEVRPLSYDLVWLQNRMEAVFDYTETTCDAPRTLFAFAHLDMNWDLAQPGVLAETLLGQVFVVTSERAVDRVVARGLPRHAVRMFRNAAPAGFEMAPPAQLGRPRTLFIVSNHPPPEVLAAAGHLRRAGIAVEHWGRGGDIEGRRLLPRDLARADGVITIGKTIPYALRARRPAYVYDRYGGPGWLRDENLATVGMHNFSGRCCYRRVDAGTLAAEVLEGYPAAAAEAASRPASALDRFRLEDFVTDLIAVAETAPSPGEHRTRLHPHMVPLAAERSLTAAVGHYFAATMRARRNAEHGTRQDGADRAGSIPNGNGRGRPVAGVPPAASPAEQSSH